MADDGVSFREKIASIGFVRGRPSPRKEYRRGDGVRVKEVTDEHGNLTRSHNTGDTERVDVEIRPQTVVQRMG